MGRHEHVAPRIERVVRPGAVGGASTDEIAGPAIEQLPNHGAEVDLVPGA